MRIIFEASRSQIARSPLSLHSITKPAKNHRKTPNMLRTSSSSSSSFPSIDSFEDFTSKSTAINTIKLLCSYGGKILPRYPDSKLRYVGGNNRLLVIDRNIPFLALQAKLEEICGWSSVSLRCQLPNEDLDALVSITSDEDLAHLMEEFELGRKDQVAPLKIRAFLFRLPFKLAKPPVKTAPYCFGASSTSSRIPRRSAVDPGSDGSVPSTMEARGNE